MIDPLEFRKQAHHFVDWIADYLESIEHFPVKSTVNPGEIYNRIPEYPPEKAESIDQIFQDFQNIILPGITHWQSPNFFAYFPANSSYPSLLAEMLTASLGTQCMLWETSPSAAELEEKMTNWLKKMTGLPEHFHGVIQDTASTSTLTALLTAREKCSGGQINDHGFTNNKYRIYCSTETHSSIEKAVKIAGFGRNNLVKVPVDEYFRMNPLLLETAIKDDIAKGLVPLCVVATLGTTGSTAVDPLDIISRITSQYKLWLHVDAAFAGTALLLEEYKWMIHGVDKADSFVFNPHKWMFTNFDCSTYFVKDKDALIRTFSINPEYLKTRTSGKVNDYRDWGIQLGRRFRALKLWFVIRSFGTDGLKEKIRFHISLAEKFEKKITDSREFELLTPRTMNLICFRFKPENQNNIQQLNQINELLMHKINATGKIFLSHTVLKGSYSLRLVVAQTNVKEEHIEKAWELIRETAHQIG